MQFDSNSSSNARLEELVDAWKLKGVQVCIWKSADRWQEGLDGKTDFDFLVAEDRIECAHLVLLAQGWIPVQAEKWRSFPGLFDYVSLRNGVNHHIHLHDKIVSGEKLTKSLRPPLSNLYLEKTIQSYPPFVQTELEFVIYIVRMMVKLNWVDYLGALKRRSTFALYRNYIDEYELLRNATQPEALARLLEHPALRRLPASIILTAHQNLSNLGWSQRRILRRAISDWRVETWRNLWFRKIVRLVDKRKWGVGKTFAFRTPTIAVCGADGSGKTTLVNALERHLARHLRVSRLYMGSNILEADPARRFLVKGLWFPYLLVRKSFKTLGWRRGQAATESLYKKLDLFLLRRQKMHRLREAELASRYGETVLFERYPLFCPFGDDHQPSLQRGSISMPDILVFLEVSESTALARRREDRREVIQAKVKAFGKLVDADFPRTRVLVCAESESVEVRVNKIADFFDEVLSERAQM